MVKTSQATAYGDLQILDPDSDLSFDDGSTSKFTMTSEAGSKASSRRKDSLSINTSFFKAEDSGCIVPSIKKSSSKPAPYTITDKTTASSSVSSDVPVKRFSFDRIFSRSKATSFDAAVKHRQSFLKRKAEPWIKTRQGTKDKRIKYHSFSNDGYDDKDDLLVSTQDVRKIVDKDIFVDEEVESPRVDTLKSSVLIKKGAYDNRPIHNNLFHGSDHDDSFHRNRNVGEPLLKLETVQQISALNADDENTSGKIHDSEIQWPFLNTEMRDVSVPAQGSLSLFQQTSDYDFNPFNQEDDSRQKETPKEGLLESDDNQVSRDIQLGEEVSTKKSFFANLRCKPKRRSDRRRSKKRKSLASSKRSSSSKGDFPQERSTFDAIEPSNNQEEDSPKMSRSNSRNSLLDDEMFEKESRQLDLLVNEFQRESPQLMRMPVASQLSAITEVDEDLTQRSSSLSAHSSIEVSGHVRYVALNPMLDDSSFHTEEPNFFASSNETEKRDVVAPMQVERAEPDADFFAAPHTKEEPNPIDTNEIAAAPMHVERAQADATADIPNGREQPAKTHDDNALRYLSKEKRRSEKKFHFKGEEITLSSNSEEDSSGGVSDITEEFIHFPVTSPLFKKAMDLFRDVSGDEEIEEEQLEESRDDIDVLKPLAQLHI